MKYKVNSLDPTGRIKLYKSKSKTDPSDLELFQGENVILLSGSGDANDPATESDDLWGYCQSGEFKGWIEIRNLAEEAPSNTGRFPIDLAAFTRTAGRVELGGDVSGGSKDIPVVADYLIAWASIEGGDTNREIVNHPPNFTDSDAEGPYRITSDDWERYSNEINEASGVSIVSPLQRRLPISQVAAAAFLARGQFEEFAKKIGPGPDPAEESYTPSYLNVFHAHLLGVDAAVRFQKLKDESEGSRSVEEILEQILGAGPAVQTLMDNRSRFLKYSDSAVTINRFFELTDKALAMAFRFAYELISKHADYLLPPNEHVAGNAPWMEVAYREKKLWDDNGYNEASGTGLQKVIEYLASVNYPTDRYAHWCGGFTGYCLTQSSPSFVGTLVKGGATAANWIGWGDVRLRNWQRKKIPVGALVVLEPSGDTSGHVGFFVAKVPGTTSIKMIGGNQSDKITDDKVVKKNRIREIRWLSRIELPEDESNQTEFPGGGAVSATEGDVLVLARTIYGEARGEDENGKIAVANVMINRVRNKVRGDTVTKVCKSPKQFSCWNLSDPNFNKIKDKVPGSNDKFDQCHDVAVRAVRGELPLLVGHINVHHYHTHNVRPQWAEPSKIVYRDSAHVFYRGIA